MSNQLLIDVSVISKSDAGTGIQRVVRNLYLELLAAPPSNFSVHPVAASRTQEYRYLPSDFLSHVTMASDQSVLKPVRVSPGDIFLGLDLVANIVPAHIAQLYCWRRQGVRVCFLVYDLLPVIEPQWFKPITNKNFRRWLRVLAIVSSELIAISKTVQRDVHVWMTRDYGLKSCELPCASIQMGGDIGLIVHKQCKSRKKNPLQRHLDGKKYVLMVGTIEPRKGHSEVLNAFEQVWKAGDDTLLAIVGREGWNVGALINRLLRHPEAGKRLIWIDGPCDEDLWVLYENCAGLIMASKGEGLGLPLIEAAMFKKPLLVRDIPVFREIAGDSATYFSATGKNCLLQTLGGWINKLDAKAQMLEPMLGWITWRESCLQLIEALLPTKKR